MLGDRVGQSPKKLDYIICRTINRMPVIPICIR